MMKKVLVLILCTAIVFSAVACTKTQAPETGTSATDEKTTVSEEPAKTVSEPEGISSLEGSPDDVVEKLEWAKQQKWAKTYKVGFANLNEAAETCRILGDYLVECCDAYGMEVIRVDNANDGAKAVSNADYLISMDIDALVEFNVDASVAEVIMNSANKAGIPVIAIDIPHPGAIFFGADNAYSGILAGKTLAQYAKDNWGGEFDCLLQVDQLASGELPRLRVLEAETGMKEVLGDFSKDKVINVDGGVDAQSAQRAVSDFLSAHPDWHRILIVTLSGTTAVGTVAAIETLGRGEDCVLVGATESYFFNHVKTNPEEDFWHGCVVFNLMKYGQWIAPALRNILDTGEQPENIYVEHQIVTRDNIDELFPDWRELLAKGVYPS
jgi:ribose transport system substrate-binding protein